MRDLLLITVDSLRYDHLGVYGYERETTPFIDEMASESHVFEQAFAHAGATRASFPAILSSSYPLMYGGYELLSDDRVLISEVLADAGYRTGGFHSNLFLSADAGYDRGFDQFYDSRSDPTVTYKLRKLFRDHLDQNGYIYRLLKWAFDKTEKKAGVELGSLYTAADDLTDMAIEWIEEEDGESPTFAWIHYMDVHHPYVPPKKHQTHFREEPIGEREAVKLRRKMLEDSAELTDREKSDLIDLYDAEIRFTDAEIGRLVRTANETLDDPVVLFTGDHGEELGDHGKYGHGYLHDECLHVPLVLDDGTRSGSYDQLVGLMDVAPTLSDYAEQPTPDNFFGYSLRKLIEGAGWMRSSVISEYGDIKENHYLSYRDTEWAYIFDEDGKHLYNRRDDPTEQNNVFDAHDEVTSSIEETLTTHTEEIKAAQSDVDSMEMDEEVVDRLEQLGYKME
jgi:arylsulfatase A-like enzyme